MQITHYGSKIKLHAVLVPLIKPSVENIEHLSDIETISGMNNSPMFVSLNLAVICKN